MGYLWQAHTHKNPQATHTQPSKTHTHAMNLGFCWVGYGYGPWYQWVTLAIHYPQLPYITVSEHACEIELSFKFFFVLFLSLLFCYFHVIAAIWYVLIIYCLSLNLCRVVNSFKQNMIFCVGLFKINKKRFWRCITWSGKTWPRTCSPFETVLQFLLPII